MLMNLLFTSVNAQEAAAAGQQNPLVSFLPFIIIFFIFYFLMIRPQKKQLELEQSMLNGLSKGDEVYTKSGLLGTVAGLTEKIITLEISEGVKIKILRSHVGGLAKGLFEKKEK